MNETVSLKDALLNSNDTLIPLFETPEDESRSIWIYGIVFSFILTAAFILILCRLCQRKSSKKGINLTIEDVERGELSMKKNIRTDPRRQDIKNEPQREQEEALNVGDARESLDNPEISSLLIKGDSVYYRGVDDSFMSVDSSHRPPPIFNYSVTSDNYETAPLHPPILDETKDANVSLLNAFSRMAIGERSNAEQNDVFITPEQSDVQVTTEQCDVRVTPEKAAIPSSLPPTTPEIRKSPRNRCPKIREDLGEYAVYDYDEDGLPIFVTVRTRPKPEVPESKTRRKPPAATSKTPEPKTPESKTRRKTPAAATSKTPEPKTPESKTRRKPPTATPKTPESIPAKPLRSKTLEKIADIKSQTAAEGQRIPKQSKKFIGNNAE